MTLGLGGGGPPTTRFHAADGSGETRPSIDTGIMSLDADWSVGVGADDPMSQDMVLTAVSLDDPADRSTVIDVPEELQGIAALNPAGTLLAYVSRQSGGRQVFCTRFPDGTGKWQVSIRGGARPVWSPDGATLYFENTDNEKKIYAVEVATEPSVRFGMPQEVLDAEALGLDLTTGWSVTADGRRFVMQRADIESGQHNSISVIENWYEEYRDQ